MPFAGEDLVKCELCSRQHIQFALLENDVFPATISRLQLHSLDGGLYSNDL